MIARVWHGWVPREKADTFEAIVKNEVITEIEDRRVPGYRGFDSLRRNLGEEEEFISIMWFDSMDSVKAFAGEDYEIGFVPPKPRSLLSRFDERSQHYEVRARKKY